jgi:putative ABC transport system permease protein
MNIRDTARTALKGLTAHKSRSFLTMLGIIIGIASVIMMMSLGKGAEGLILGQINDLGPDSLFIRPGGGDESGGPPNLAQLTALKYSDYEAVAKLPSVRLAAPILMVSGTVSYQGQNSTLEVTGTTPSYQDLNALDVADGRFFDQADIDSAARVVVLGSKVATDLFDGENPLGKTIRINRKNFMVIGVLPERGSQFFQDLDKSAYVPISAARRELKGVDYVNFMSAAAVGNVDFTIEDIRFLLRDRHGIDNPTGETKKDDFLVLSQVQAAATFGAVSTALTIFLTAIASISLVVGGIGIMNIMLVSVTERTREIGLRKAVGATRGNIMLQFLLEAMMLTMLGGLVGVAVGASFSFLASKVIANFSSDWEFSLPLQGVLLSVGVASMVGLVFGLYPAQKASKLDPIEALRYE